ncbi:MAG: hypothetical protein ACXADH_12190 [Candidatus Kariarchaeaceae archaeon]|jgi:hypothetical protein
MKFTKPVFVRIDPRYALDEDATNDIDWDGLEEMIEKSKDDNPLIEPVDGIFRDSVLRLDIENKTVGGGPMHWGVLPKEAIGGLEQHEMLENVQLLRLFAIQLTKQMVLNQEYVNEAESKVNVDLSKEETIIAIKLLNKLDEAAHQTLKEAHNTLAVKRKPKKFEF